MDSGTTSSELEPTAGGAEVPDVTSDTADTVAESNAPSRRVPTRRQKIVAVALSAALSLGIALIVAGITGAVTGDERSRLPEEIERIQPALGDKVLNQSNIVVDLIPGYTGRLIIDNVPLATQSTAQPEPGSGGGSPTSMPTPTTVAIDPNLVRFDAGNNTLNFQPRPGAFIERFAVGRHTVKVIYWKITESEAQAYSYFWYFDVTA